VILPINEEAHPHEQIEPGPTSGRSGGGVKTLHTPRKNKPIRNTMEVGGKEIKTATKNVHRNKGTARKTRVKQQEYPKSKSTRKKSQKSEKNRKRSGLV
jgi:hypothetical protein